MLANRLLHASKVGWFTHALDQLRYALCNLRPSLRSLSHLTQISHVGQTLANANGHPSSYYTIAQVNGLLAGKLGITEAASVLLKAKREVPGAAERQKTLAAQDGKCALCGCGLTGACELDHVVPVRQAFAGSVQTLQALCGDCHSEKTLRESAQPTSLESRVAPGVMEYVRSPKLPPLSPASACRRSPTTRRAPSPGA